MTERTLSIIKPGAVKRNASGPILKMFGEAGFRFAGMKMLQMDKAKAEGFYGEHKGKGFFDELVEFMTSGPVVLIALEKDNAVKDYRTLIGDTNPANAAEGTVRKIFAVSMTDNGVHGSDSPENGIKEINYFFNENELF